MDYINNIYILDYQKKLPKDIIKYINNFIPNPIIESKKYRYNLSRNSIINNIQFKLTTLFSKYGKFYEYYNITRWPALENRMNIIENKLIIILSDKTLSLDKILYLFNKSLFKDVRGATKHQYYNELKRVFMNMFFLDYDIFERFPMT